MLEILIGFIVSLAIALTGVGAGTVVAPVMILFLDVPPAIAIGTALAFGFLVKVPVGISYMAKKMVDKKILGLMVLGGLPGVILGSTLLGSLAKKPELEAIILGTVGIIVLTSAGVNFYFTLRKSEKRVSDKKALFIIPIFTLIIGFEVGFSSAGAGALGTLLLLFTTSLLPREVVGTDILFGLVLAAAGGGLHLGLGNFSGELLMKFLIGAAVGVPLGVYSASRLPSRPIKIGLLAWISFIGAHLIYQSAITVL